MLIGSEIFMELICNESSLKHTCPALSETKLSWVVSGRSTLDVKAMNTQNNPLELSHFFTNDNLVLQGTTTKVLEFR